MTERYHLLCTGYLYSVWNGKLKEYKGNVLYSDKCTVNGYIPPKRTLFDVVDERGKKIKSLNCASKEGVVYNKVVWLVESDRSKAAEILIDWETQQISALQMKINNHNDLIDTLRKEGGL